MPSSATRRGRAPRLVTRTVREMLGALFDGHEAQILANPAYRLHILAVRGRGLLTRDAGVRRTVGFGAAVFANLAGRRHLRHFLERTIFHDARERLPFLAEPGVAASLLPADGRAPMRFDAFHTHAVALDRDNLREALVASAAIPMLIDAVPDIPRAPAGIYWDGGLIDYHLHLPYSRSDGLVLYPHFTDRIIPGWLDKALPWRQARGEWLDNVHPRLAVARLPRAAAVRQASRPQGLPALRDGLCGAARVLEEGDRRKPAAGRRVPRLRRASRSRARSCLSRNWGRVHEPGS